MLSIHFWHMTRYVVSYLIYIIGFLKFFNAFLWLDSQCERGFAVTRNRAIQMWYQLHTRTGGHVIMIILYAQRTFDDTGTGMWNPWRNLPVQTMCVCGIEMLYSHIKRVICVHCTASVSTY